jgi:hypothetical protein
LECDLSTFDFPAVVAGHSQFRTQIFLLPTVAHVDDKVTFDVVILRALPEESHVFNKDEILHHRSG